MNLPLILFTCLWAFVSSNSLQCRDENNNPVDWFVAIKLPHLKKSENENVRKGVAYIYITSETSQENWSFSPFSVDDPKSIMGNTLKPLYEDQVSNYARILYNDEPPHGNTTMTLGHTKGVVVGDASSGFWLIHSVPHYPPEANIRAYSYPKTGVVYGQSFLCISVLHDGLEKIGQQLMYNEPDIYDAAIPDALRTSIPQLANAAKGARVRTAPWFNLESLSSVGGQYFSIFAKSGMFGKDLYADWVAQELRTDLLVETWNHGPAGSKMQSECEKPFKVENVESISVDQFSFTTGEDHSKWAVASVADNPWVCIGDINRMEHQKQRGGGTACLQSSKLFNGFRKSIINLDVCPVSIVSTNK